MELSPVFWFLVFICCFGQSGFGIGIGYTSPAMPLMIQDETLTDMEGSWFSSVVNLGCMAGSFVAGAMMQGRGRHFTLLFMSLPCTIGWLIIILATLIREENYDTLDAKKISTLRFSCLIIGRLLTGIGFGMSDTIVPTYLSEIAPDKLRGACGCLNRVGLATGFVIIYSLGMTSMSWQWMAVASSFVPTIVAIALLYLPESPRWYLLRGQSNMASNSLRKLSKMSDKDIEREIGKIEAVLFTSPKVVDNSQLETETKPEKGLQLDRAFGRTFALIAGILILKQFCGMNAVLSYAETIFVRTGFENESLAALILGCVQLASTVLSVILIDRLGRRPLLLVSAGGMCIALTIAGVTEYLSTPYPNVALVAFLCYAAFFSVGLGPLPNLIMSEIFKPEARGFGSAASLIISNVSRFIVVVTFESMQQTLNPYGCYWLYAAICLVGLVLSYFYLPETKNVQLEKIAKYFE